MSHQDIELLFMLASVWIPCLIFIAYPTIAFIRGPLNRWRRHRKGLCVKCGYNLIQIR